METRRLEVASFPVRQAAFDTRTAWADGVLAIEPEGLRALVLRDSRIREARLELVHPGEPVRILRALDAIEPLSKVRHDPAFPGGCFPGFLGPPHPAGAGRTHRLAGFSVVQVTDFPFPASGVQAFEEGIVEMAGPGALYSACADRVNLLLVLEPGQVSSNADYDDALRRAALRVADALAAATAAGEPPRVEGFSLEPPAAPLPRIAWVHQVRAQGPMVQTYLYGHEMSGLGPTLLHPNELLDGALVGANYKTGSKTPTFGHTRHPSLLTLYDRHGRDLDLAGVIVARGHHESESLKERAAGLVATLAATLGVAGVLCTYEGTGNTHIDFMLTVQALERAGIPTASVVHEYGGPLGSDPPLVDFVPEARALASSGGIDRRLALPPVARVVGGTQLAHRGEPAQAALDLPIQELYAATLAMNERGIRAEDH
jgi:glycine reductase complex component B subunit alpha and beta